MSKELKTSYLFKNFSVLDCKVILLRESNRGTIELSFSPNISEACCIRLAWPCFVAGSYRGAFCEKLPEASSMSGRANLCWVQRWICCWPRLGQLKIMVVPLG